MAVVSDVVNVSKCHVTYFNVCIRLQMWTHSETDNTITFGTVQQSILWGWCAHARAPRTLSAIAPKKISKVYDLELWSGIHCGCFSVWYCCKGITSIYRWQQSLDCTRWGVFLARLLPPIRRPLLLCSQVAKCSALVHLLFKKWCRCTHRPFPCLFCALSWPRDEE